MAFQGFFQRGLVCAFIQRQFGVQCIYMKVVMVCAAWRAHADVADFLCAVQSLHSAIIVFGYIALHIYIPHHPVCKAALHRRIGVMQHQCQRFCARWYVGNMQRRVNVLPFAGIL